MDEYRYIPFEEWADVRGATVASAAVRDRLRDRFEDLDLVSVGVSNPPESGDTPERNELQVSVDHRTEIDESGEVIDEPSVSVPELVDATPRSLTATVHFADHTATNTYPVVVRWYTVVPLPVREENNSTE